MGINVKAKGTAFERKICEALSKWLTNGEESRACWRSDTSGAAATVLARKNKDAKYVAKNAGDIRQILDKGDYPVLDRFFEKYVVECKHYKEIDFYPPFNGTIRLFLDACIHESKLTGKQPILIVRENNRKILLFSTSKDMSQYVKPVISLHYNDLTLHGYVFDELIKHPYNVLEELPKKVNDS